jgi:hypothetical protein
MSLSKTTREQSGIKRPTSRIRKACHASAANRFIAPMILQTEQSDILKVAESLGVEPSSVVGIFEGINP